MDCEWSEAARWALDENAGAFNEIQDMHRALGIVLDSCLKPVSMGLDKFFGVQAGALFSPANASSKR